jgi:hypothetical protein
MHDVEPSSLDESIELGESDEVPEGPDGTRERGDEMQFDSTLSGGFVQIAFRTGVGPGDERDVHASAPLADGGEKGVLLRPPDDEPCDNVEDAKRRVAGVALRGVRYHVLELKRVYSW